MILNNENCGQKVKNPKLVLFYSYFQQRMIASAEHTTAFTFTRNENGEIHFEIRQPIKLIKTLESDAKDKGSNKG